MGGLQLERLSAGIMGYASCESIVEYSLKYMNERSAFGRTINKFQVLRHRVAQLAAEIECIKIFTLQTCKMHEQGKYVVKECSMVKLIATELADKVMYQCLQFFGGYGYMEEYKVARAFRDSRIGTIGGGSSEIMREIIAKMVIDDIGYERAESNVNGQQSAVNNQPTTVDEIFATLPARFKTEKAKGKNLNVEFKFDSATYFVSINDGNLEIKNTADSGQNIADCTVETDDATYIAVETGKLNPQEAFMTGKIKVSDIMQMMAFGGLFKKLN
jgi:acyl-CoA dehydrogenase